jgi:addiction module HigA family antidote
MSPSTIARCSNHNGVHPGHIVADELRARRITRGQLARAIPCKLAQLERLLDGVVAITPAIARQLESTLGPSAIFWLELQHEYDEREH